MPDVLLELFSEEIPARMQPAAAQQLHDRFKALLTEAGLSAGAIETHATPRRLALIARDLPAASAATAEERRGPRADAPPQAVEGFLKSTGLTRDQLEERDTGKGVFLFANIAREGRPAADILGEKLPAMIAAFQWPKSQRWGAASSSTASPRWVRPLREIVALLDDEPILFEALGVRSGRTTFGHRFMGSGEPICITSPSTYAQQLHAEFVILSEGERRAIIRNGAEGAAHRAGLTLRPDEGLEAENAGLTEWPVPLLGHFDPAFLDVPPEIIQLTMRTNQKYFAVEDADGKLAPAFVCVANLDAPDGGRTIVSGNERVLSARLADARFFWEQDRKVSLETHAEKLGSIVFHEKLGTMAEKVDRVAKLARWLVESSAIPNPHTPPNQPDPVIPAKAGISPPAGEHAGSGEIPASAGMTDEEFLERVTTAAKLCKADLTTATVGEFPELQGIIGGYLAEAQGEMPGVVSALKQHYAPVPEGCIPVAVALADRLDTLVGFFGADIRPTGSKDPFAIRRACLSVVAMIDISGLRLPLCDAVWACAIGYQEQYRLFMEDFFVCDSEPLLPHLSANLRENMQRLIQFGPADVLENPINEMSLDELSDLVDHGPINDDIGRRWGQMHRAYFGLHLVFLDATDIDKLASEILDFIADRLKVQQREAGVRHDLIDAVFALGGEDDLVRLLARVKALQAFVETDDGANLLAGYKRAANILKAEEKKDGATYALDLSIPLSAYTDEAEKNLARLFVPAEGSGATLLFDEADALLAREDFEGAMKLLATLRAPVDAFFEKVTVNDPDPAIRARRLGLLAGVREAMHRVADFSRIEG